jgi:hypothetical protein
MQTPAFTITKPITQLPTCNSCIEKTVVLKVTNHKGEIKDPCVVFDGNLWHIYGTGGIKTSNEWQVLHAISKSYDGKYITVENIKLLNKDGSPFPNIYQQIHAPGVIYDNEQKKFFFIVQTTFTNLGGTVEFFSSTDGDNFYHEETVMKSAPYSRHAGVYDPHISTLVKRYFDGKKSSDTKKVFVFTGIEKVALGRVYLAESISDTWNGPWEETSCVLWPEQIKAHHNQDNDPNREWCTEGAQLFELDEDLVSKEIFKRPIYVINAVGFYPFGDHGTRQHNFFTASFNYKKGYTSLGPVHPYSTEKEMGHGSLVKLPNGKLGLYRQERSFKSKGKWNSFLLDEINPDKLYLYALKMLEREEIRYEYQNSEFIYV